MSHDPRHNGGPPIDWTDYGGFTVEARDSRNHPIIGYGKTVRPADPSRGSYSCNEAWRDLIHECLYKDGTVINGGKKMAVHRGQMLGAIAWLANRWNWTAKTVRCFLERLEDDAMITKLTPGIHPGSSQNYDVFGKGRQKGTQAQVITICNYDKFNPSSYQQWHAEGQADGTQGARKGHARGMSINKETIEQEERATATRGAEALRVQLSEIGIGAIANPAGAASLLSASDILAWIECGCDPILDIIPAVSARCTALRAKPAKTVVRAWSYFNDAVHEARDRRRQSIANNAPSYDCYFDGDRLIVANGFKTELLATVDGDEIKLKSLLDIASAVISRDAHGENLKGVVRKRFQYRVNPQQRGTRLPENWILTKSLGEWAVAHFAIKPAEVRDEAEAFRDYWQSVSGTKGVKLDWDGTFRNWVRNSRKRYKIREQRDATQQADLLSVSADDQAFIAQWEASRRSNDEA